MEATMFRGWFYDLSGSLHEHRNSLAGTECYLSAGLEQCEPRFATLLRFRGNSSGCTRDGSEASRRYFVRPDWIPGTFQTKAGCNRKGPEKECYPQYRIAIPIIELYYIVNKWDSHQTC